MVQGRGASVEAVVVQPCRGEGPRAGLSWGGVRRTESTQAGAVQVRRSLRWERADAAAEDAARC